MNKAIAGILLGFGGLLLVMVGWAVVFLMFSLPDSCFKNLWGCL